MSDHEPWSAAREKVLERRLGKLETQLGLIDPEPDPPSRHDMTVCIAAVVAAADLADAHLAADDVQGAADALGPAADRFHALVRAWRRSSKPVDTQIGRMIGAAGSDGPIARLEREAYSFAKGLRTAAFRGLPAVGLRQGQTEFQAVRDHSQVVPLVAEGSG